MKLTLKDSSIQSGILLSENTNKNTFKLSNDLFEKNCSNGTEGVMIVTESRGYWAVYRELIK